MSKDELSHKSINALVEEALAIEAEHALEAGALGFMCRALTQATMPHSKKEGSEFMRRNGNLTLSITSPSVVGLPYGSIPRLMVSWLTTEAVRTNEREIILGRSMASFMEQLGLYRTGGKRGDITRFRDQCMRLFSSTVVCIYSDEHRGAIKRLGVAEESMIWWDAKQPEQVGLWESTVMLTREFFEEVTSHPVPVDMRALQVLKASSMALDIYIWLTYRMSYLKQPTLIPWAALKMQFGADYKLTRQFKAAFLRHLKAVLVVYPEARVEQQDAGLHLTPSPPHVARKSTPLLR
jgi:hypothetical protein